MDDQDQLFVPPAPTPQPAPAPGALYKPQRKLNVRYNHTENVRVRALVKDHLAQRVDTVQHPSPQDRELSMGYQRGKLIDELMALADAEHVAYYHGRKAQHAKGAKASRDSLLTQLRQWWEGRDLPHYMVVLLEAVVCRRNRQPYPGEFYNLQRRMPGT